MIRKKRFFILIILFILSIFLFLSSNNINEINKYIDQYIISNKLPSVSVMVINDFNTSYKYATGVRKRDSNIHVTLYDPYHIGSITKSFTSLLTGIFVDKGLLTFDTKIKDILKNKIKFNNAYSDVTIRMLLSHTSGVTDHFEKNIWNSFFVENRDIHKERKRMVEASLHNPPVFKPGTNYLYSNFNYVIAGYILEILSNDLWENLIKKYILSPLSMKNSGFGNPDFTGKLLAPWGHTKDKAIKPSLYSDNPASLGPAGTIYANIYDLYNYSKIYFKLSNYSLKYPQINLISEKTLLNILRPVKNNYALGWGVSYYNTKNLIIWHDGSNTYFYARIYLLPYQGFGIIILTNQGSFNTSTYVNEIWKFLIDKFYYRK